MKELIETPYSITLVLIALFCVLLTAYWKRSKSQKCLGLPPGPPKLPIIGNMHQLSGALPHHALRRLASKHGPIMHVQMGEISMVVITSAELAREIMKTHDLTFANRPDLLGANIITYNKVDIGMAPYGNHWRQLRKICTLELLSAKRVQSFKFIRQEEVSAVVKEIYSEAGSVINLTQKVFTIITSITARATFGEKCKDQEAFISSLADIMELVGNFSLADLFPSVKFLPVITGMKARLEKVHKLNDRLLENIIKEHTETKERSRVEEENLLDVLLRIQKDNDLEIPLSRDTIKAVVLDMFIAGTETSATVIDWAMAELMRNPKVMEKAQAEVRSIYKGKEFVDESEIHQLKYTSSIVKETLRMHQPGVLLIPRENLEQCVINGYVIPAKTRILINAWAISKDPKNWDEPDRFNPERFFDSPIDFKGTHFEYLPFGAGRRICPGIAFSIPSVELVIANLLYHFDWKLPSGVTSENLDMSETFGGAVRRTQNMLLIPIPYRP